MKRDYIKLHTEVKIPDSYVLRISDIDDMAEQTGTIYTAQLWHVLCSVYAYGFERGRRYEKKRLKACKEKA